MTSPKIRLYLCNLCIALWILIELSGILMVLLLLGIVPVSVVTSINLFNPIPTPSYFVITPGEGMIISLMYIFIGWSGVDKFMNERRQILKEIGGNVT